MALHTRRARAILLFMATLTSVGGWLIATPADVADRYPYPEIPSSPQAGIRISELMIVDMLRHRQEILERLGEDVAWLQYTEVPVTADHLEHSQRCHRYECAYARAIRETLRKPDEPSPLVSVRHCSMFLNGSQFCILERVTQIIKRYDHGEEIVPHTIVLLRTAAENWMV